LSGIVLAQSDSTTKSVKPKAKTAAASKGTATKTAAKTSVRAAPPKRYVQFAPTPQRYQEIQQALADKGFFVGPIDGNWGPGSVESLKRFQRDQGLDEDGKIGSQSLIHLGLGPQRAASVTVEPVAPAAPNAPEPPR